MADGIGVNAATVSMTVVGAAIALQTDGIETAPVAQTAHTRTAVARTGSSRSSEC